MINEALEEVKKMSALAAKDLRSRSPEMNGTEIIAEETYIPLWGGDKDYTNVVVGAPVQFEGQVYTLLQKHNANNYPYTPPELASLWRVKHTTDPAKAKPWVKPTSTSDMYLANECMVFTDGITYKCLRDTIYSPIEYAPDWEQVDI